MVTKRQLQSRAAKQAARQKVVEETAATRQAEWLAIYDKKNEARVRTLLDGELGEALQRWSDAGLKQIKLDTSRVWGVKDSREVYSDSFSLGFPPKPDYEPTKILLTKLKRAGFKARVVAEEHQNVEFQHGSDGMGPVSVPGTHTEYFLIIDWS